MIREISRVEHEVKPMTEALTNASWLRTTATLLERYKGKRLHIDESDANVLRAIALVLERHDELVAACEAARKILLGADIPSHPMRDKCFSAMGRARVVLEAALAKAKGNQ